MATIDSAGLTRIDDGPVATVYSGQHAGVVVALKVFPKRLDKRTLAAFNKEQAKLSTVRRVTSILPVHGVDELTTGEFAVRMERCTQSLAALVDRVGSLPPADVVVLGRAVAEALAAAHGAGVVHGGISPHNVLFRTTGEPVVADFGVTLRQAFARDPLYAIEFLPPETLRTGTLNEATDLYGLGAVLHYALSGRSPHPGRLGEQPGERVLRILGEPVPAINNPDIPVGLSTLVARLLAADPARRLGDAAAVTDQLGAMLPNAPRRPATDDFDDFSAAHPTPPPAPLTRQAPPPRPVTSFTADGDDFDDFAVPAYHAIPPRPAPRPAVPPWPVARPPHAPAPVAQPPAATPPPVVSPVASPSVERPPVAVPSAAVPPLAPSPVAVPPAVVPPGVAPSVAVPSVGVTPVVQPSAERPPAAAFPAAVPPVVSPVEGPPAAAPPVAGPPAAAPPVVPPSVERSPVAAPPVVGPPAAAPPVVQPSVERPSVGGPSAAAPPTAAPPVVGPSVAGPLAAVPPVVPSPVVLPSAELPPVAGPSAVVPPVVAPSVAVPSVGASPVVQPSAERPPAAVSPAVAPPVVGPSVAGPSAAVPPAVSPVEGPSVAAPADAGSSVATPPVVGPSAAVSPVVPPSVVLRPVAGPSVAPPSAPTPGFESDEGADTHWLPETEPEEKPAAGTADQPAQPHVPRQEPAGPADSGPTESPELPPHGAPAPPKLPLATLTPAPAEPPTAALPVPATVEFAAQARPPASAAVARPDFDIDDDFADATDPVRGRARARVLASPLAPPGQAPKKLVRYDVLAGAALLLALLALVPLLLLRGDPEEISSTPRVPAANGSAGGDVEITLDEPVDLIDEVRLSWTAPDDLDFIVVVAAEGKETEYELAERNRSMTLTVDGDLKYCFRVQATDGNDTYESNVVSLRNATCKL